jgi:hypothetical protein
MDQMTGRDKDAIKIYLRLPPKMHEEILRMAEKRCRYPNDQIVLLLRDALITHGYYKDNEIKAKT